MTDCARITEVFLRPCPSHACGGLVQVQVERSCTARTVTDVECTWGCGPDEASLLSLTRKWTPTRIVGD